MINLLARGLTATARQSLYRWRQRGADVGGGSTGFGFGSNAAISEDGNTVAVYAQLQQYQSNPALFTGAVTIFQWDGKKYAQIGQRIAINVSQNQFGKELKLSATGTRVAIQSNTGSYIYDFNGTTWNLNFSVLGRTSIAMTPNGTRFAIGGASVGILVYDYNGTTWIPYTNFSNEGRKLSFAKNGNRIANQLGQIYELQNGNWVEIVNLNRPEPFQFAGGTWLNQDGTIFAASNGLEVIVFQETSPGTWTQLGNTFFGGGSNFVMSCSMSDLGRIMIKDQVQNAVENTWTAKVYDYIGNAWQQIAPTRFFYNSLAQSPAQISGDGKTFGFQSNDFPNVRDGSVDSYSLHRKELD